MNTPIVSIWTEPKAADTSDQAAQDPTDETAQVEIDGGSDDDATNLNEPKDRWWLYREAARFGLSFDLCLLLLLTMSLSLSVSAQTKSSSEKDWDPNCKWGRSRSRPVKGTVKITSLGSHEGNLCRNDRAFVLEDPTGLRILWDPGRTTSEDDIRLQNIHILLLSSVHSDHVGDAKPNPNNPGSCAQPGTISAAPYSVVAAIAARKNAAVFASGEMAAFLGQKIREFLSADLGVQASPTLSCSDSDPDNPLSVPQTAPCIGALRPGGNRTVRMADKNGPGVTITAFQAFHSNGIPPSLLGSPSVAPGTTGYAGNDGGFVIEFTNGLHVYLTGDTGPTADMKFVIKDLYDANLVIANVGDTNTMSPSIAARVINEWVKPTTVIPTHINQESTSAGAPSGKLLLEFLGQVDRRTAVEIPLSGVAMEFDGRGRRVNNR